MIYTDCKYIPLPSKKALVDLFTRTGPADANSFTPFNGAAPRIAEQFGSKANKFNIEHFLGSAMDLKLSNLKPTDQPASERVREDVVTYYKRYEQVGQDYIDKFVTWTLSGYKINRADSFRESQEGIADTVRFFENADEDSTKMESETDLIEAEETFDRDRFLEAKQKLPHLLRILHEGSKEMGVSLLSFMIAYAKCKDELGEDANIGPRHMFRYPLYTMTSKGTLGRKLSSVNDKSSQVFYRGWSWIDGDNPNDLYYRKAKELLAVLAICDIDIKQEDPHLYQTAFIDKMVCTYIMSNEEFIEDYGWANPTIIKMLTPDRLSRVIAVLDDKNNYMLEVEPDIELAKENIAAIVSVLGIKYKTWAPRPKVVDKFLKEYTKMLGAKIKTIDDYYVENGVLKKKEDGSFVVIDAKEIAPANYMCTNKFRKQLALLSISGYLIAIDEFEDTLDVLTVEEALSRFRINPKDPDESKRDLKYEEWRSVRI